MLDNIFRIANDFNDLEKLKIYNLISQKGGGNMDILKLIFGSILIVIGLIFIYLPSTYSSTIATVTNINTDSNLYKYVTLNYNVNNQAYTKQIVLGRNHNLEKNSTINIYHDNNDPNIINLDINTYYVMAFIFVLFGLYIIFINNKKPIRKIINDTSIYSTDSNLDNIQIL